MPNEEGVTFRTAEPPPADIPAPEPPPQEPVSRSVAEALKLIGIHPTNVTEEPSPEPPPTPTPAPDPNATPAPDTPPAPTPDPGNPPPPAPTPAPTPTPTPENRTTSKLNRVVEKLDQVVDKLGKAAPANTPPPAAPEPEPDLRTQALQSLSSDPKYRGRNLVEEYQEYEKSWKGYKQEWIAKHPGEKFDPEDEAHDSFRDAYEPDIDDRDLVRAEARLEARREAEEAIRAQRAELARERIQDTARRAEQEAATLLTDVPIDKLEAEDPAKADAIEEALPAAKRLVRLAHEMFTPGSPIGWDQNNPDHRTMMALVGNAEDLLASQPADQTTLDGRRFVTAGEWNKLSERERQRAWTPAQEPRVVEVFLGNHLKATVEARAGKLRERYTKRAAKFAGPTPPAPTPALAPTPAPVPAPTPTPTPPAGGTPLQSPVAAPGTGNGKSGIDYFFGAE